MDRNAVRIKRRDFLHRMLDLRLSLTRKPDDQIHINIVKSKRPCKGKGLLRLLDGMLSSDQIKRFLVHRLRVDRDAADAMIPQHLQLFCRNAVRTSGFHRKLPEPAVVKSFLQLCQKAIQLFRLQRRRSASADVDCIQLLIRKCL